MLEQSFFPFECVCVAAEIDKPYAKLARKELTLLCHDVAKDGISLVAVEQKTNKVVAFAFNKIQVSNKIIKFMQVL